MKEGNILRLTGFFLLVALVVAMEGCLSLKQPSPIIEYYTLEYETLQPETVTKVAPLSAILRIERFGIAPDYNTDSIVYRDQEFKRTAYTYHRWRKNPADLVTFFLRRDLRNSGMFRAIIPHTSSIPYTHIVEGGIDEFLEWDTDDGWNVVVSVTVTLLDARETDMNKKVILQRQFSTKKKCDEEHPKFVVKAMSSAMAEISKEICIAFQMALSKT